MHIKVFLRPPLLRLPSPGILSKGIRHHMNFILDTKFLTLWEIVLGDSRLRKHVSKRLSVNALVVVKGACHLQVSLIQMIYRYNNQVLVTTCQA